MVQEATALTELCLSRALSRRAAIWRGFGFPQGPVLVVWVLVKGVKI